jgi:Peptidase family C25
MPPNPSTAENEQSIKLSVTVKSQLERKYDDAALEKIQAAVERWKKADGDRGIQTVHVEVDNSEDETMKKHGAPLVSGKATPKKIKKAIDHLWKTITPTPHYLVLFGGHDIVPMFVVPNPSNLWKDQDFDKTVPTDNPYASSEAFSENDQNSYLVPDRVIGRIPDMVSARGDTGRNGDPAWFVAYLDTATEWESKPDSFYEQPYVICTDEAKEAGKKCLQKAFPTSTLPLLSCPPTSDTSAPARQRLSAPMHMIKCHGNKKDATFWGFEESDESKDEPRAAITSATLKEYLEPRTVVATMCCYGAQIFSPEDADTWPLASTYLRKGALGYVGSTMMAWVGLGTMSGADWIVTAYLKSVLEGESIGLAFLKSKQDYHRHDGIRGRVIDVQGEKTLIEYILLGDPSIHPVSSSQSSIGTLAVQERQQRRVAGAMMAAGIGKLLPIRSPAEPEDEAKATEVYASEVAQDAIKDLKGFSFEHEAVRVQRVDTRFPDSPETMRGPIQERQSLEYYWTGKRERGGNKQLCLLKVETDLKSRPWRVSVTHTS